LFQQNACKLNDITYSHIFRRLSLSHSSLSLLFFPSFSNLVYHSRSPSIIIILLFVSFIVSYIDVGSFIVPTHFSKWYKSSIFRLEKCHLRRGPKRPGRWMKPPIQSKPKRIIKFNNNLMITGMIPMYASWSLRRLLMPLLFASTQSCKTLSSPSVSPVYPRRLSTQLRLNTLLQRTSLPSSMGPVKVHLLITHYVDQNESFLFFLGKRCP